jgi:hypothetical protein
VTEGRDDRTSAILCSWFINESLDVTTVSAFFHAGAEVCSRFENWNTRGEAGVDATGADDDVAPDIC